MGILATALDKSTPCDDVQVVFADVVAYSSKTSWEQAQIVRAFNILLREALKHMLDHSKDHIPSGFVVEEDVRTLALGDGAAIVFPRLAPDAHLFLADELLRLLLVAKNDQLVSRSSSKWPESKEFEAYNFDLRCGVSNGLALVTRDINGELNVAGDPVNNAARVMGLGDSQHIFLTREAFHQVTSVGKRHMSEFRRYTSVKIKHNIKIEVYQYVNDNVAWLNNVVPQQLISFEADPTEQGSPVANSAACMDSNRDTLNAREVADQHAADIGTFVNDLMVRVPGGAVSIGKRRSGAVVVEIPHSLNVMKYPVTQDVYRRVTKERPSQFTGGDRPVENVSWVDAAKFCNELSEIAGLAKVYHFIDDKKITIDYGQCGYRLPTEAEWEYLCRTGSEEHSESDLADFAWYTGNAKGETHPVGQKHPNGASLYDMLGNVWEWCNVGTLRSLLRALRCSMSDQRTGTSAYYAADRGAIFRVVSIPVIAIGKAPEHARTRWDFELFSPRTTK